MVHIMLMYYGFCNVTWNKQCHRYTLCIRKLGVHWILWHAISTTSHFYCHDVQRHHDNKMAQQITETVPTIRIPPFKDILTFEYTVISSEHSESFERFKRENVLVAQFKPCSVNRRSTVDDRDMLVIPISSIVKVW
jgi:hypothetical protein